MQQIADWLEKLVSPLKTPPSAAKSRRVATNNVHVSEQNN